MSYFKRSQRVLVVFSIAGIDFVPEFPDFLMFPPTSNASQEMIMTLRIVDDDVVEEIESFEVIATFNNGSNEEIESSVRFEIVDNGDSECVNSIYRFSVIFSNLKCHISSFKGMGIYGNYYTEGFHCIQRCPHFRRLE